MLRTRYLLEFLATFPLVQLFRYLPERVALRAGAELGRVLSRVLIGRRRIGMANLSVAFPERSRRERARILSRSFQNLGRTLVEVARLSRMSNDEVRRRVSYSPGTAERLRSSRGSLLFTGHICNWEFLALAHSLHGSPMHVVVRRLDNPFYNRIIQSIRARGGNVIIQKRASDSGVHELMDHLKNGGQAGILVDQYASRSNGIVVPFFGRPARTHRGPAIVAMRTDALLLPSFMRRIPDRPGHYEMHVEEPLELPVTGSPRERLHDLTERMQRAIEDEIRRHPEEWLWVHRRWKRMPGASELYREKASRRARKRRRKTERARQATSLDPIRSR